MSFLSIVSAQITNPVLDAPLQSTTGRDFYAALIPGLITLCFVAGVIFFFFKLLQGGLKWIQSGGDKNSVEEARDILSKAIIGIVILFSVYAILQLLQDFLGGINLFIFDFDDVEIF